MTSDTIRIVEMGPRDGLQNEPHLLPAPARIELIRRLTDCRLTDIEAGAFVSPRWVPQMADSDRVFAGLPPHTQTLYWALVPNLKGYQAARLAGARHIAIFAAASESFSMRNTNAGITESLDRLQEVAQHAQNDGVTLRGYVSCALGCPFEGDINPQAVARVTTSLLEMGCSEVSIGDTIGTGTKRSTEALFKLLAAEFPVHKLAAHFHDTYGQALANLGTALQYGVRIIDSSVAGLGGCPYAPGATGNVASEDVVHFCHGQGLATGIDLKHLAEVGAWISALLNRPNASRAGRALLAKAQPTGGCGI